MNVVLVPVTMDATAQNVNVTALILIALIMMLLVKSKLCVLTRVCRKCV